MTVALLTLTLSLPAAPAPKVERPEGPAPLVVMISPRAEGQVTVLQTEQTMVPVQKVVTVATADGRTRQVTQTVMVATPRQVMRHVPLEQMQFYGPDGKKMESKDVKKLLTKPMPALLSADGKPVDRFYLRLASKGTLVLVIPPVAGNPPAGNIKIMPAQKLPPPPREK
jgi:hypothetical protein